MPGFSRLGEPGFLSGDSTVRSSADSFEPRRRIVSGDGFCIATGNRDLLHNRLRAAALVLAFGFLVFFVANLVNPGVLTGVLALHAVVLMMLAAVAGMLSFSWKPPYRRLRSIETAVFAVIGVYFVIALYLGLKLRLNEQQLVAWKVSGLLKTALACMLAVIYTYALFVPSDARRAARLIVPMALGLLVAPLVLSLTSPGFRELLGAHPALSFDNLGEHAMLLAVGAASSIYGVHTIRRHRTEAFQGRELNQYRLIQRLGSGGMGDVYLAEHALLKRPCAIKLINRKLEQDPTALARFELEVRATARLSHPNTVEVYDYGRSEHGAFFYVMEYLPGCSLQELVDRHGPLPGGRVIHLLSQACGALSEAHGIGLIHRDLKPPNIFSAYRGGRYDVAKVLDFGLVKPVGEEPSSALTLEGVVTGSPLYMAPELIVKNHVPDARVDVYGIGAVAYFLLTGRPPFLGPDAMTVMVAHARDPVEPPSTFAPGVPPDLERVVLRCLEKQPADRYQDAASLARALEACADADGWSDELAEAWWRANQPIGPAEDPPFATQARSGDEPLDSLRQVDFGAIADPGPGAPLDPELTIVEDRSPSSRGLRGGPS